RSAERAFRAIALEEPAPLGRAELADAALADRRIPEEIVVDVRCHRRPDHERCMQRRLRDEPEPPLAEHLATPDDEAPPGLEGEVHVGHGFADDPDQASLRDADTAVVT